MERWVGRVALVTGASAGIGAAICQGLVKHGLKVVGCARSVDRIKALAETEDVKKSSGSLHAVKCDLSKEADILATFDFIRKTFGHIDVCINCAGLNTLSCSLMNGKTEDWRYIFEVNVLALCICTREAIQIMKEKNIDDGQIINISSLAGHMVMDFGNSAYYGGSKAMVNYLTEGLRKELRKEKTHIRTCTISPGLVKSEFIRSMSKGDASQGDNIYNLFKAMESEDMAEAVIAVLQTPPHVDINNMLIRPTEETF